MFLKAGCFNIVGIGIHKSLSAFRKFVDLRKISQELALNILIVIVVAIIIVLLIKIVFITQWYLTATEIKKEIAIVIVIEIIIMILIVKVII